MMLPREMPQKKPTKRIAISVLLTGLFASLVVLCAFPIAAASSNTTVNVDLSEYQGHWQRIDDDGANEARFSAIGHALEGLSWIMRKFASPILRKTTTPPTRMDFTWDGNQLHERVEGANGNFSRAITLDGAEFVAKDSRGVEFSSAWSWTEAGLLVRWEQHQAVGNNIYRIDPQDQILIVEHTIIVTAISNVEPIIFLSRFSRSDSVALVDSGEEQADRTVDTAADRH